MKSIDKMLQLAALAAMFDAPIGAQHRKRIDEDIDTGAKSAPTPKGLKKFIIDGKAVWAINEKNARRKAAKLPG